MKYLCIYHDPCPDGFAAAWVFNKFATLPVSFHPSKYGDEFPWHLVDKQVIVVILDFSYPRQILEELKLKAENVVILDHHKTAEESLRDFPNAIFDMNRSGAGIAWDHFFPNQARPWLVNYVEDRDLWKHKLPCTKEVNAYISFIDRTFKAFDAIEVTSLQDVVGFGSLLLKFVDQRTQAIAKRAALFNFEGYEVPVVNCEHYFTSDVGNILGENRPFAVCYFVEKDGMIKYSLRSAPDGVDVSEIAKKYGGGGHKHAAGFTAKCIIPGMIL